MKKAIGGLLVVSMLTAPTPIDLNYMAYLALRGHSRLMYVQLADEEQTWVTPGDIDKAMTGMEENARLMTHLLKERAATLVRLDARMAVLSHSKTVLEERQMNGYTAFMDRCRKRAGDLTLLLKTVEGGEHLHIVQKEIMRENSDYSRMLNQLGEIITAQNQAIDNLTMTICEGEALLAAI